MQGVKNGLKPPLHVKDWNKAKAKQFSQQSQIDIHRLSDNPDYTVDGISPSYFQAKVLVIVRPFMSCRKEAPVRPD